MNKLIVTEWNGQILTALMSDGRCRSLHLEPKEEQSLLGTIYIGKVKNVVKNINAAFIDLGGGRTGYYSLTENRGHLFADQNQAALQPGSSGVLSEQKLKQGDEIVVQVSRDAVKTKDPVLTSNLNFTGKYLVLTIGKTQIGFSNKLRESAWKEETKSWLESIKEEFYGIIVRTNADGISREVLAEELEVLKRRMTQVLSAAPCRICYSVLESPRPPYIQGLRDTYSGSLESILTDVPEYYERMKSYLEEEQKEDAAKLKFYEDPTLPLLKLYSLEAAMESALAKRVWLKSGGYLIIEPTEALTVIDVNTGKYTGKKSMEETILKINLEAAEETAKQLCLRNLSGIIIVDFIDMSSEEHKKILLDRLEEELKKDPVKTVLVEMTKLGLVEITRKKVRKPLHENICNL